MLKVCGTGNIELYERGLKLWEQLMKEDEKNRVNTQNGKNIHPPKNNTCHNKSSHSHKASSHKTSSHSTLKLDAGRMF